MMAAVVLLVTGMPVYASKMDNSIESSAKKSYVFKTYLKDDDIKIQSKDGVVTLTGTVSEESHKALAQETVAGTARGQERGQQAGSQRRAPSRKLGCMAQNESENRAFVPSECERRKTEVDVKNGTVTLRGNADSEAQKELTTEYAKDVEGVKDVRNEMTVPKTSKKILETGAKRSMTPPSPRR